MTETIVSLYYPLLFSFSVSLVLPTMFNLFKKNIHSLKSFTTTDTTTTTIHRSISSGLGLVTATTDPDRPPYVLESATLKPSADANAPPPPPPPSPPPPSGRIGFIDDIGGEVDGLMSCTESLGFESSDERRVDDQIHEIHNNDCDENDEEEDEIWRRRMMRAEGRGNCRKLRSFPPPLSSLNRNGKPSFFLRPVRKDGRLELTEVRIHRPEILHASRHDGRLTLHLIPEHSIILEEEEEEEMEEEEEVEDEELEEEEEKEEELVQEEEEMILDEEEEELEEIRYGREERVSEWGFSTVVGGNEGLRRCHEMVNQHHHVHGSMRMCGISIV